MEQRPQHQILLSVNVDHIATLRQARSTHYPDPLEAALLAETAGAGGITVHLREDRRHIQEHDVERIREGIRGKLNLEIAATTEMLDIAARFRPPQVTLVPERPDEVTTEGGLDLRTQSKRIQRAISSLAQQGTEVSVFLDPEREQVDCLAELQDVTGFEINTDTYTRSSSSDALIEAEQVAEVAAYGAEAGLRVYAGHGLTTQSVPAIAAIPEIEELNIGHSIVSRAALIGMKAAVEEILAAIRAAR